MSRGLGFEAEVRKDGGEPYHIAKLGGQEFASIRKMLNETRIQLPERVQILRRTINEAFEAIEPLLSPNFLSTNPDAINAGKTLRRLKEDKKDLDTLADAFNRIKSGNEATFDNEHRIVLNNPLGLMARLSSNIQSLDSQMRYEPQVFGGGYNSQENDNMIVAREKLSRSVPRLEDVQQTLMAYMTDVTRIRIGSFGMSGAERN